MFNVHNINANTLSVKNLILLFLTIVLGFASVITLADISIPSVIDNAWQTIGRITITEDGTDTTAMQIDISSGGIYINSGIIPNQGSFSGKVLGIDDNGRLVYAYSNSLVVSGGSGGGTMSGDDGDWTIVGSDIYSTLTGNVGIGTSTMSGKLHIKSSAETELYLEESNAGNAANINLKNTVNTWMVGGYSDRFYIGNNSFAFLNILNGGNVGIGTTGPKVDLQVVGNFIAGDYSNTITGSYATIMGGGWNMIDGTGSSIGGGGFNNIKGMGNFVAGGSGNILTGKYSSIGGGEGNIITGDTSFIGGGQTNAISGVGDFIGGGGVDKAGNKIHSDYSSIVGGKINQITDSINGFIGGGQGNSIVGTSSYSTIPGGLGNYIENAKFSFAGGKNAQVFDDNTFIWNGSLESNFTSDHTGTFIVNAPGGVGIQTPNPKGDLHIAGSGTIIFQPQPYRGLGCSTTGAVYFNSSGTTNHLCYCDGVHWNAVGGGDC